MPATLLDTETNEIVENVHDWRVADYLASGRYRPLPDAVYRVVAFNEETNRWNSEATVRGSDLVQVITSGQAFLPSADSEDTARQRNLQADTQAELGGAQGQLATALTGLGSGMTMGATDVAIQAFSPETFNQLQAVREANPLTDALSTGVGTVVPLALGGAPATIARAVGGMGMRPFASRMAAEALLGTAEGAMAETAMQMRNPQFSASAVAQSAGLGFLWGGALSGIFQAGAAGLSRGRQLAERFRTSRSNAAGRAVVGGLDDAVGPALAQYEGSTPKDVVTNAASLYRARQTGSIMDRFRSQLIRVQSGIGGTPEETLMALRTPEFVDLGIDKGATDRLRAELFDEFNTRLLPIWRQAREQATGAARTGERGVLASRAFREGVADLERESIERFAQRNTMRTVEEITAEPRLVHRDMQRNLLSAGYQKADELVSALEARLRSTAGASPAARAAIADLRQATDRVYSMWEQVGDGRIGPYSEAYAAVDDIAEKMRQAAVRMTSRDDFFRQLMDNSSDVRSVLGNPSVVGRSLADFRHRLDITETAIHEPLQVLDNILGDSDTYGHEQIDSAKLHSLISSFAEPESGATNYDRVTRALSKIEHAQEAARLVKNNDPIPPELEALLDRTARDPLVETPLTRKVTQLANRIRAEAIVRSVSGGENQSSAVANLTSAGAGAMAHQIVGGTAGVGAGLGTGLAITNIFRPGQGAIRAARWRLHHGATVAKEVAERRTSAVTRLVGRLRSQTGSTLPATVRRASMWANWLRDPQERQEVYGASSEMIREIATNPEMRQDILTARMSGLYENDPDFALALADVMNRSLDYLFINLPKGDTEVMPGVRVPPSQTEIDSFMRRVQAIEDPYSLIDDFADGIVSPEAVDAVRNVHPEVYADVVTAIGDAVQAATEGRSQPIPYTYRVQMATMFGNHMDPTTKPSFVNAMQSHSAQTSQQASVIGRNFNGGQLDTAKNTRTNVDDLEEIP